MNASSNISERSRVLVVDDESGVLDYVEFFLEGEGFEVARARDYNEALDVIEGSEPPVDVVVLDMMLPVVDGETMARFFRLEGETAPYIIAYSAFTERGRTARNAGAHEFLPKTAPLSELGAAVRRGVTRRKTAFAGASSGSM